MRAVADFGTGTKILLAAGSLLFVSLFLTWQTVPADFGPNVTVTQSLDGWDFWGLVIALATLAVIGLAIARERDDELAFDPRIAGVVLGLGAFVLVAAVLKNLRDSDSTWASYLGVLLAGAVALGAYLDFSSERDPRAATDEWRPPDRSTDAAADQAQPRW